MTKALFTRPCLMLACVTIGAGLFGHIVRAQDAVRTVADGVYTDDQANRGAAAYDTSCSGCHRPDLGGASGPALRGERFARMFAGKDLKIFFTKVATTMPRGAPATMGDAVYLDIVAHVLRENGFPAGMQDLTTDGLSGIDVLPGRPKPPPPVGDFSYVEVVGCLVPGPDNTWLLSNATEPVGLALTGTSSRESREILSRPLGTHEFRLLDAMAYDPESLKGRKMYVKGLLIKLPGEQRMTISSFEPISTSCTN